MRVLSIVGARPQLVKLAPIAEAFTATDHEHVIVHTGQHYDADLSDVFFTGLRIPPPDVHLGVGSGSHGVQTGAMMSALDAVVAEHRPDWVLVYGDTNSTVAGALVAVKQHVRVAHLEAGLRSFNRRMPEEHNRVATDHLADLLLAPTEEALRHLGREGLEDRAVLVGDVMTDVCLKMAAAVEAGSAKLPQLRGVDPVAPFLVATVHRPDNTDSPQRLRALLDALAGLPVPVALLAHPRLVAKAEEFGIELEQGSVHRNRPLPYAELVAAVVASQGVVTDSGGLQKEALLLGRPCTTLRTETEWVETLQADWNRLVPDPQSLAPGEWVSIATRPAPTGPPPRPFGDGRAAQRSIDTMARWLDDALVA